MKLINFVLICDATPELVVVEPGGVAVVCDVVEPGGVAVVCDVVEPGGVAVELGVGSVIGGGAVVFSTGRKKNNESSWISSLTSANKLYIVSGLLQLFFEQYKSTSSKSNSSLSIL